MGPRNRQFLGIANLFFWVALLPGFAWAQSFNATIRGTVFDPTGAVIPDVEVTLTSVGTGAVHRSTTGPTGLYSFPNLQLGAYELKASAQGFRDFVQTGISVSSNESVRVDVSLGLGRAVETIEVTSSASPLNFENAEIKGTITPQTIEALPLLLAGSMRSAVAFAVLMPGVSTGPGANPFNARINGGMDSGDEAVLDGVSMQQGVMSQSGMVSHSNFPIPPEAISEVSVLTSNYEPQYGSTTSGIITAVTKSGTSEFHGRVYEFLRNRVLNARQFGVAERPIDIENDFGFTIGGPIKIPKVAWSGNRKTFFFFSYNDFYIRGGTTAPILSLPSLKQRSGDFSDWRDSAGNLIPVYDPDTTRPDGLGGFTRDQFMGCDGNTPNVICPTDPRLANSLANQWFQFLPGLSNDQPLDNFVGTPVAIGGLDHRGQYDLKLDHYVGTKDHFSVALHLNRIIFQRVNRLQSPELATESFITLIGDFGGWGNWVNRGNWDHTFSPTLINTLNYGYLNFMGSRDCVNSPFIDVLPKIPGVASFDRTPRINLEDFNSLGCNENNFERRPTNVVNDLLIWVKGSHTFKFGAEYRASTLNNFEAAGASGTFNFSRLNTGLTGVQSGNAVASFLLEQVNSASARFDTVDTFYARAKTIILHVGDTWKVTPKLTLSFGLRWDLAKPSFEKFNHTSFLDPLGANPSAGGRPGRLAFAGTGDLITGEAWPASAAFGSRHPEDLFKQGFAPRLGIAYSFSPKTVVRTGYGIFYTQAFYPSWRGGMSLDGFSVTPSFTSSLGGIAPAFILSDGFPQNFQRPPFIDPGFLNGQAGPLYRPFDANRLSYSQQWNLTVEHQFTDTFYVSTAYVGNKGTRLPSTSAPLNALDPQLLSLGQGLFDEFQTGQTVLNGVPIPYAGWIEQMTSCPPSVAQALQPFPQYCGSLQGLNENAGNSTYHSFQLKAEKRFRKGTWMLVSYTLSKLLTSVDNPQQTTGVGVWSGAHGIISPFERQRNKGLATEDVPHILSVALLYDLPVGRGKRWASQVGGPLNKVLGGWQISSIFRATSGPPFFIRSSVCNVPAQFRVGCIPALLPGANPFAQDKGNFDPNQPLLDVNAFESADSFNFSYGVGPRISNFRGFPFYKHDFAIFKNTQFTERVGIQFRAEMFNVWNWHSYNLKSTGHFSGIGGAFTTDVSSPNFGMWNGAVSDPRNIQLGLKILF